MINIAVDGFTGSGKSALVKLLAKKLGDDFKILDTGAIFRAMAYALSQKNIKVSEKTVSKFVNDLKIEVMFVDGVQHVIVDDFDTTNFLRTEEISQLASKISVYPKVREKYLEIAKNFAGANNCIMEGRDIGSVVMPNADVKIFLTADENIRAKRRFDELKAKGVKTTFAEVLKDLKERDLRDTMREVAPLVPADDRIIVDNSDMNLGESVDFCYDIITKKFAEKKTVNIAIDGYVCSGKSTIAKALAKKLNFRVFDTGAVYRAIACAFSYMHNDENKISEEYICKFARQIDVKIGFENGLQHIFVNGIDYTPYLRTEKVSALTAKLSPFVCIREKVLNIQREFAKENNCVMEGRDIGSFVLPNADFKFFCTADEKVRAQRRFEQQKTLGNDVSFDEILLQLRERDFKDVHREHGAIKILPDSIVVDTTNQTLEQSVEFCLAEMKKRKPKLFQNF